MGWKISTLIINSDSQVDEQELLKQMGFYELSPIEAKSFDEVMNPDNKEVYIGSYKGNILICVQELPTTFLNQIILKGEKALANFFSEETEICAIVLHSVVNFWGYSVSKNNEKLRVRAGSAEDGTFIEYGNPLQEEKELLSKAKQIEGKRLFHFEEHPEEYFTDDQVGENFVFDITKRYFGETLDLADDLLFETKLNGYRFESATFNHPDNIKEDKKNKKWYKYVFIMLALIIWQILRRIVFK